jgi:hypothetical protein
MASMQRRTSSLALLCALPIVVPAALFGQATLRPAPPAPASAAHSAAALRAVHQGLSVAQQRELLDRYCSDCHNDDLRSGSMTLTALDVAHPELNVPLAEQVIRKVGVGMMPPPGASRPDTSTLNALTASLAGTVDTYAAAHPTFNNPPLHRLNRTEYANSVRSLLAVDVNATNLLPSDDMSHGFDNMADALNLSPALMDAYIRAAGKVSRDALGDKDAPPLTTTYSVPRVISQTHHVDGAPMGTRGGISVIHNFPADGLYSFKVSFYHSLDGPLFGANAAVNNGQQIEISVNGVRAAVIDINPATKKYDDIHTGLVQIAAGPQRVSAAFLKTSDGPVEDAVMPIGLSLLDLNQAVLPGLTVVPHLHELAITGPTKVSGVSETASRKRIFTCYPANAAEEQPCARRIIASLAEQAYRRPLDKGELTKLMSLYDLGHEDGGFEDGVRVAIQAVISSPSFIFRFEQTKTLAPHATAVSYRITDLELASRLSYFLWSSIPDQQLLKLAQQDQLHRLAVLDKQVLRMLADPRANSLATNFASEWLHLQNLKDVQPDGYLYPLYDRTLGNSMKTETELLFESVMHEDQNVLTLLDAHYTYVNQRLAKLYGIPNVYGSRFRRVALTDPNRYGLLGQASILTLTSASNRTSPVGRGKYVMEVLLGTPPPPPPPNIPALKENTDSSVPHSVRERLEEHRKNPTCAGCHKFMDPIGFALENFDPIGEWRTFDSNTVVDAKGKMYDGSALDGPASLRRALMAHSDAFLGTFTENLLAYGLGRVLHPEDMSVARSIEASAADHGDKFSAYILAIVNSEPFRMRHVEGTLPSRMFATLDNNAPKPDAKPAIHH